MSMFLLTLVGEDSYPICVCREEMMKEKILEEVAKWSYYPDNSPVLNERMEENVKVIDLDFGEGIDENNIFTFEPIKIYL